MTAPTGGFNGGTPVNNDGTLAITDTVETWVAGLPYGHDGALAVTVTGPAHVYVAGIPITAAGLVLMIQATPVVTYTNTSIPHSIDGEVNATLA